MYLTAQLVSIPATEKVILKALTDLLSIDFKSVASKVEDKAKKTVKRIVQASPEYESLKTGQLRTEFGIPDVGRVDSIIESWLENITIKHRQLRKSGNKIVGGFDLIGLSDFEELVNLPEATFTTEKGVKLPWLYWLLFAGDKIIIKHFDVSYKFPDRSRTHGAIMVHRSDPTAGWRVPPEFSGTVRNNFLTRAIEQALPEIDSEITSLLRK